MLKNDYANYKNIFSKNLKDIREIKKLSQKELAEKIGVPVSTYANWEQGRREPSIGDVFRLLSALEVEANELYSIT